MRTFEYILVTVLALALAIVVASAAASAISSSFEKANAAFELTQEGGR